MYIKDFYNNIKEHQKSIISMHKGGNIYNNQLNTYNNKQINNVANTKLLKLLDSSINNLNTMYGGGNKKIKDFKKLVKKQCSNVKKLYTNIKKQETYISKKNFKSLNLYQQRFKEIVKEGLQINKELNKLKATTFIKKAATLTNKSKKRDNKASVLIDNLLKNF